MKRFLVSILRFGIVAAILVFLFRSGQFEPAKLVKIFARPDLFLAGTFFIIFTTLIGALRWRLLVRMQNVDLGVWESIKPTYIGFFQRGTPRCGKR